MWWESFFDGMYADYFLARSEPEDAEFFSRCLDLRPGQRVFEQCCGPGRLSLLLAQRGLQVVGVDFNADYVAAARQRCQGLNCEFHVADARDFRAQPLCDGALNTYSSFGYSRESGDNLLWLRNLAESVCSGGRLVLDIANPARVMHGFRPVLQQTLADGVRVERECRLDWRKGMLEQSWTYHFPDGRRECRYGEMRLYFPWEVEALFAQVGIEPVELHGDVRGGAYGLDSERQIWLARRL